jgi:integrase/recombinase XerD
MAKISIVFRKDKLNKQDKAPINLKITNRGKKTFISTGYSVKLSEWDFEKELVNVTHKNSARLNNIIRGMLVEHESKLLELESKDGFNTIGMIKQKITTNKAVKLFEYAATYNENLKTKGKLGTYRRGLTVITKLKDFIKNDNILIEEFNYTIVKNYDLHLRDTYSNTNSTIHANMKYIKTIILSYIKEGYMSFDKNPFINYKIKPDVANRAYLTDDELLKLENLKLNQGSLKYHHKNMYVFSAYAGGLRISDVLQLKWENYKDEKISLRIQKTKQPICIKIPKKAIDILNLYHKEGVMETDLIFPVLKCGNIKNKDELFKAISSATAYINADLKDIVGMVEIKKSISFHTARHTFATRALQKGMRIEYVSKYLGHSDIRETQIYAKIVNQDLDKAIEIFN